jgi:hypothetical protein
MVQEGIGEIRQKARKKSGDRGVEACMLEGLQCYLHSLPKAQTALG